MVSYNINQILKIWVALVEANHKYRKIDKRYKGERQR